ncbi:MAG: hypothetical protein K2Q18_12110, partial [Bdellovibrionales bacterium]|nr:hypothetical protein [Bdellovibrionales bacterium]
MEKELFNELLRKSQLGDSIAYEFFLTKCNVYLLNRLKRWIRRSEVREEITQEILLGIHHGLKTYQVGLSSTAWINAITKYKVIDFLRKNPHKFEEFTDLVTNEDEDTNELIESIYSAMEGLAPETKQAIMMTKIEGHS